MNQYRHTQKRFFLTSNSLLNRFFFASLIILPLFIILSGTLLLNAFQHSQINAEEEKLQAQLYLLLSVTEVETKTPLLPEALTEPRLNQVHSGLYGFIVDANNQEVWRSASAKLLPKTVPYSHYAFRLNQRQFSPFDLSNTEEHFYTLSYDTEWLNDNEQIQQLRFIIISDAAPLNAELNSYRSRLWQWLGSMGIALILAQVLIMRWGLQPLKRLSQQLQQLQRKDISQLDSNYPTEVQPIIDDFNSIFVQEKQQRERYRNTMSDLAHSLKTPLAVIQSQLEEHDNKDEIIHEQITRINQIIAHQLQRAVIRINQSGINHNTDKIHVKKVIDRLLKIMTKVYQDRNITFNNLANDDCIFFGDEADLLEVLGNLIDNACKHGHNAVTVTAENQQDTLAISISDNGNGVDSQRSQILLQRGERADTVQPGQGLGLSVAVDIISSYGGEIIVSNNVSNPHLSGACFTIRFESLQIPKPT
jgi:two-component system sensor histidine kinase PhoQ